MAAREVPCHMPSHCNHLGIWTRDTNFPPLSIAVGVPPTLAMALASLAGLQLDVRSRWARYWDEAWSLYSTVRAYTSIYMCMYM